MMREPAASSRDVMATAMAAMLCLASVPAAALADGEIKSQLTLRVEAPVLQSGGTVLVVATAIPKHEWDKLPANPRASDKPQSATLKPGDKRFEASIATKVSIVECVYPEGGTFGFELLASGHDAASPPLRSRRIGVGSGYYTDRQSGKKIEWNDVSTIHIYGPEVDEAQSRLVRVSASRIMNAYPAKTQQPGVAVYAPSADELERSLLEDPT